MLSNIGVLNRPLYVKSFYNNLKGMNDEQEKYYLGTRSWLSENLQQATSVVDYSFKSPVGQTYPYNPIKNAQSLSRASDVVKKGGVISMFDLETVGMPKAMNSSVTDLEHQLRGITEFTIVQDIFDGINKNPTRQTHQFTFGISPDQKDSYLSLIDKMRRGGVDSLTSTEYSTLERIGRYAGQDSIIFNPKTQLYEVKKIGESTIDNLDHLMQGLENLTNVGWYQGLQTQRGKIQMTKAMRMLKASDVSSGYNINKFDKPFLNAMAKDIGLAALELDDAQNLDLMEVLRLTDGDNLPGLMKQLAHNSQGNPNYNPGYKAGTLEAIAKALGIQTSSHLAEADVKTSLEIMLYQPHFGNGNQSFLEYANQAIQPIATNYDLNPTLTNLTRGNQVIYANRALRIKPNQFDYFEVDGQKQTHIDYAVNRGEYYKLNDLKFLSAEQIKSMKDETMSQKMLENLNGSDGLYVMNLQGASKHNSNKQSFIFRSKVEDFDDVFKGMSLFNLTKETPDLFSVTKKMMDKQTKLAIEDRVRREVAGYFVEGERQYKSMKQMYDVYSQVELAFKAENHKLTKRNVDLMMKGKLANVSKESIFKEVYENPTASRYTSFQQLFGFLKSSSTEMRPVLNTIESNVSVQKVRGLYHGASITEKGLDSLTDIFRTQALNQFFSNFEFQGNSGGSHTVRDAFTLFLPSFQKDGLKNFDKMTEINFMNVKDATSTIMSLTGNVPVQKTRGGKSVSQMMMMQELAEHMVKQKFLPENFAHDIPVNANPYDWAKNIASHVHKSYYTLYEQMGYTAEELAHPSFTKQYMKDYEKLYDVIDEGSGQTQIFAQALNSQREQYAPKRFSTDYMNVTMKNSNSGAQSFNSFIRSNHVNTMDLANEATQMALSSSQFILDGKRESFNLLEGHLRKTYGYSKSNIDSLKDVIYGVSSTGRAGVGGMMSYGDSPIQNMMVQLFDEDGKLYMIATERQKAARVNQMLFESKQAGGLDIERLKQTSLVLNLPVYDQNYPGKTFKMGTVHKSVEHFIGAKKVYDPKDLLESNQLVELQVQDTIDEVFGFWRRGRGIAEKHIKNHDYVTANQVLQRWATKPIMDATSFTGRQSIISNGALTTTVIPNMKDLTAGDTLGFGYIRSLLPFLYENDQTVQDSINKIFKDNQGMSSNQVSQMFAKEANDFVQGRFKSLEDSDMSIALGEYVSNNLIHQDELLKTALKYSDKLSLNTIETLEWVLDHPQLNQIVNEKRSQGYVLSLTDQVALVPYAPLNDLSRANVNQGLTHLSYDMSSVTDVQRQRLTDLNIHMGDRVVTNEAYKLKQSLKNFKGGQYKNIESTVMGGLKAMTSTEVQQALNRVLMSKEDMRKQYAHLGSQFDDIFDDVMGAFRLTGTFEGGGAINPYLKDSLFSLPELVSVKVKESQLEESKWDELLGMFIDEGGTIQTKGGKLRLHHDKAIAGRIASRDGNTLFIEPANRKIHETKIMFAGNEKMVLQDPASLLKHRTDEAVNLMNDVWKTMYGKVAAVANPEFLKHETSSAIVSSYLNRGFSYLQEQKAPESVQRQFLSILQKNLPDFGFDYQSNEYGERMLTMNGILSEQGTHFDGFEKAVKEIRDLGTYQRTNGGGGFVGLVDELTAMHDQNIYYAPIQRVTNSEMQADSVKYQRRASQTFGTVAGKDHQGNRISLYKVDANGKTVRYSDSIIAHEEELLRGTRRYRKGFQQLQSIEATIEAMKGNASAYGLSNKIVSANVDDVPILPRGVSAELMDANFYKDVPGTTDQTLGFKLDLGSFEIKNGLNDQAERFVYIPKVTTEIIDGQPMMTEVQKRVNDLLQAVDILKNRTSDKPQSTLLHNVQEAYDLLTESYFDEKTSKTGIMQSRVLEGRIPYSVRGLGASIIAPVTTDLMETTSEAERVATVERHKADLKEGGRNFHYANQDIDSKVVRYDQQGDLMLNDVVFMSEHNLKRAGIDFTEVGRQVLEDQALDTRSLKEGLLRDSIIDEAGKLVLGPQYEVAALDTLEEYELRIRQDIASRKNVNIDDVVMNEKLRSRAKNMRRKDHGKLKMAKRAEEERLFELIGKRYFEETGQYGTIIRDPAFHDGAKNVAKIYLNPLLEGESFYLTGHTALRMNQDNDGDTDGVTLFLEKHKKKTRLMNQESQVIQDAQIIHDKMATVNATTWAGKTLDTELAIGKTGVRQSGEGIGEDIASYKKAIEKSRLDVDGEYITNAMRSEDKLIRANKNRHNKMAIGYISTPNFIIREMANGVYNTEGDAAIRESILNFTRIAEQDILDIKHIKDAGSSLTPVESYSKGLRLLSKSNAKEKEEGLSYIISALEGPIFKNGFTPQAQDVMNKIARATHEDDKVVELGLMSLYDLFQDEDAIEIFNSPFVKPNAVHGRQAKFKALRDGVSPSKSELLEYKRQLLQDTMGFMVDSKGAIVEDNTFYYTGTIERQSYQSGFYKIKDKGMSQTDRAYMSLENVKTGDTIQLKGDDFTDISTQLVNEFQHLGINEIPEEMMLREGFANHYMARSLSDYQSFVTGTVESEMSSSMIALRKGTLSESEFLHQLGTALEREAGGDGLEYVDALYRQLQSRNDFELDVLSTELKDYFTSSDGQAVKEFAKTTSYMQHTQMTTYDQAKNMIRQFNQDIKDKAFTYEEAKINAIGRHGNQNFAMVSGQLKRLEKDASGMGVFAPLEGSTDAIRDKFRRYGRYDIESEKTQMKAQIQTMANRFAEETEFTRDEIMGILNQEIYDPFVTSVEQRNMSISDEITDFFNTHADERSMFGWVDTDTINRQLVNYNEDGMKSTLALLENSIVGYGDYAGASIEDLSLGQLKETLNYHASGVDSSVVQQTRGHIETYLNALDHVNDEEILTSIRGRHYERQLKQMDTSNFNYGIEQLNDAIRQRAQVVESPKSPGMVKRMISSTKEFGETLTPGKALAGLGIVGAALGVVGAISSTQFTASNKALEVKKQGKEEHDYQSSSNRVAPPSYGSTTYLNQNNPMNYRISARHDGRYTPEQHANFVTQALTTGQPTRTTVNSYDNRNEISNHWLESQLSNLN